MGSEYDDPGWVSRLVIDLQFSGFENGKKKSSLRVDCSFECHADCVKLMLIYVCLIYINMILDTKHDYECCM